jgi:cytochrome c-type biogenesis protein
VTPDGVTYLAAFGGRLVSFLSPCVLPLVPAYLSLVTGLDVADVKERRHTARVAFHTGLFIAGFSAVFVLLGLSATTAGKTLFRNQVLLTRVSGLVVVAMALFVLGSLVLRSPWLYAEKRFHPRLARFGPFAAPVAGVAFGFGWTPCIGPVLTSVLAVAATREGAARGALLLATYHLLDLVVDRLQQGRHLRPPGAGEGRRRRRTGGGTLFVHQIHHRIVLGQGENPVLGGPRSTSVALGTFR